VGTIYRRGNKLWLGYIDATGKQRCASTGLEAGHEREAKRVLEKIEARVAAGIEHGEADLGPVTVARFGERWIKERRQQGLRDVDTDEGRLRKHVLPHLGTMPLDDVRPKHLIAMVKALRAAGKLAPRTVYNVYGLVHTLFRDAVIEELIAATPAVLSKNQLGKKVDADPEWRVGALFTRAELEALISSDALPWDRRVLYALEGLAGLRHGEAVGLLWRSYEPRMEPLGRLVIARSYDRAGTKTERPREVPVHPTLAGVLAEWKRTGWVELMGKAPGPDDLVVPSREGAVRSRHHSRNKLLEDLARLGLRHRRGHDLRRTFITLVRVDGGRKDILEAVTHSPRGNIIDIYTSLPWTSLCEEVAKLKVELRSPEEAPVAPAEATVSATTGEGGVAPAPLGAPLEPGEVERSPAGMPGVGTAPSTTVRTTVPRRDRGLVANAWNRHMNSRRGLVEAPGVEPGSASAQR
jgi:integrase